MGGVLDFALKKSPEGEWDPTRGDRHLEQGIEPIEWEKLFFDTLGAPKWEEYIDGEDVDEFYDRQKTLFQTALSAQGFIMLSRIWRIYRDVHYQPFEIDQLLSECVEVQMIADDACARSALEKLISACQNALKNDSGLLLLSD